MNILRLVQILVMSEPLLGDYRKDLNDGRKEIHIAAVFAYSGTKRASVKKGHSEVRAAEIAVEHINRKNFISGHRLVMDYNDTKCDPGTAIDVFYDFIYRKPKPWMLIGPVCSEVAKMLAEIAKVHGMLMISYGASSPALSQRKIYPTFFRLASSDSSHNDARMHFVKHFKWSEVTILCQDEELFTLAASDMAEQFDKNNVNVTALLTFTEASDDITSKMNQLKKLDSRIIFGLFHENVARKVFCEAVSLGLYGQNYVWILLGWYTKHWWLKGDVQCDRVKLSQAVAGYFAVDMLNELLQHRGSMSGLSSDEFKEIKLPRPKSIYAPITYDSLWTAAYVIQSALLQGISLDKDTYDEPGAWKNDSHSFTSRMLEITQTIKFLGISGPVSFKGPDRVGLSVVMQNQGGEVKRVALFHPNNQSLDFGCPRCFIIDWKGKGPPADHHMVEMVARNIDTLVFCIIAIGCSIGSLMAIIFLCFNLFFRRLKYIKLSSPRLNDIVIIGCIEIYAGVILIGLDTALVSAESLRYICTIRVAIILCGISLSFGALFMKTYRVYKIFRMPYSSLIKKNKFLKDLHLIIAVLFLTAIDALLVVFWDLSDPLYVTIVKLPVEMETDDRKVVPYLTHCHSDNLTQWSTSIYAYKGILLLFGAYLAFETRNVKVDALNDSQYIGFSVYSVVVVSVIVVVLSHVSTVANRPTWWYGTTAVFVLLSTTSVLCFLFLPKIYVIARHKGREPRVNTSVGLKHQAGTRRFSCSEPSELYLRAQVINAEYKRQIKEVDKRIAELQSTLRHRKPSRPHLTPEIFAELPETIIDSPIMVRPGDACDIEEEYMRKVFI